MSLFASRPQAVPSPPHDPYSLLLSGRIGGQPAIGWRLRLLDRAEIDPTSRALVLAPSPLTARWLTEETGSFGGVRLPPNVALAASGDVLILDRYRGELLRFDPCKCRFARLACFTQSVEVNTESCLDRSVLKGRVPPPLNRLSHPESIAICRNDIFIADRGHGRVIRYALDGLIPRGALHLPPGELTTPWQPTGLALDGHGNLYVSDPEHGRIDRFAANSKWQEVINAGVGVTHLTVDCDDRVYAVLKSELAHPVTVGAKATEIELDAINSGFHWQGIKLDTLPIGSSFSIYLHAGDEPWTASRLADPGNPDWCLWLRAEGLPRLQNKLPLEGVLGRYLRIRFVPSPSHTPSGAFNIAVNGARAIRVTRGLVEPLSNVRAAQAGHFPTLPFPVDARGHLHLMCESGPAVFDTDGRPVRLEEQLNGERYERQGQYLTAALDSEIDGCQWHRVDLSGAIPPGCSIEVRTTTANIELTSSEIDGLPDNAWSTRSTLFPRETSRPRDCSWDCLITNPPGRYLWIELALRGDGQSTPCISTALIEYPRVSLRRYLPGVFGIDPKGAEFTDRFTAIFDTTLRSIERKIDEQAMLFDPLSTPADASPGNVDFLSWLGGWIGVRFSRDWPVERRRQYLKAVAKLYCLRGTPEGLWRQLLLFLGVDRAYAENCLAERPQQRCVPLARNCNPCHPCLPASPPPLILEHFKLRRWLYAGHGRLGNDSVLWGKRIVNRSELSGEGQPPNGNAQVGVTRLDGMPDPLRDPFHVTAHKFSVFVPARIRDTPNERNALEQLLLQEAPAHTKVDVRYVEPRFRVGVQAMIGLDSVIARTPCGVRLDEAVLRQGTVLSGAHASPPEPLIGDARVGTTMRVG